jgi:hypothetical protein
MCINFPITVRLLQNNERGFPLIFTIKHTHIYWKEKETHILLFDTVMCIYMKWRWELNIISIVLLSIGKRFMDGKITQPWKESIWIKLEILAKMLSRRYTCYNLKILLIISWYSIFMCKSFALYLCWHRFATIPCLNEWQRGEAIGFLLRSEDQISVPERFHVSQSTLSHLRRWVLTTGSLNDHFRSGRTG